MSVTINVSGVAAVRPVLTASNTYYFTGGVDGQVLTVIWQQDGTGGWIVTGGNFSGFPPVVTTASTDTVQQFVYDAQNNLWNWVPNSQQQTGTPVTYTTAGAVPIASGLSLIGGSGVTALTLAAPTALQNGVVMSFSVTTAHAHTLTTPSNKINGGKLSVTFAAIGDAITLQASGTVWYIIGAQGTTTLG